jgi:YggT family protein
VNAYVGQILITIVTVLQILLLVRAVLSWLPLGYNPVSQLVVNLTEPMLAPLRRIMPRTGMFDLTPMIAMIILLVIRVAIASVI